VLALGAVIGWLRCARLGVGLRCGGRLARGKVRRCALSNSGGEPSAGFIAVALYPLGQGVQAVVLELVV